MYLTVKQIIDTVIALCALLVLSPFLIITAIAIKIDSPGPIIFKQERLGRWGKPFWIYKFRSMCQNAEKTGTGVYSYKGDSRITKVGKIIRATSIDELPQLWNVFCGQMAFIGPRPERKYFIDQIMEHDARYVFLYQIRPGVTSYATLYNGYTDTMDKMLRRLRYDLFYLQHRSWWFDFKILVKTFINICFGKKF